MKPHFVLCILSEIVILNIQNGSCKFQDQTNTTNTQGGWAPDWLIGCEQTVEYCCYLSSLLTCSPLRWAGLQPEAALWLPGPHPPEHHHQYQHHSGQAAPPLQPGTKPGAVAQTGWGPQLPERTERFGRWVTLVVTAFYLECWLCVEWAPAVC